MKKYLWKARVKSIYGVESLVMCSNKKILENELKDNYKGFAIGEIVKSKKHYVTDGNTEIHTKVLYA